MRVKAIYGPPGTGKTTEMLRLVEESKASGVSPEAISFVSFTRAAASEALTRLGLRRSDKVSTIHSMCFRSLGMRQMQVVDTAKLREFADIVGVPITGKSPEDDEERADGDAYIDIINYSRNVFISPQEAYDISARPGNRTEFDSFVRTYSEWKKSYGFVDFTDMLSIAAEQGRPPESEIMFVDEAQDLSPLQWKVIERFSAPCKQVYIAGDDDQAIYTWSGADAHGMATFCDKHNGVSDVLSLSYRLPVTVHAASQELIRKVTRRVDKEFSSRGHEGLLRVHGSINSVKIDPHEDTLLLGRTHSVLRDFEQSIVEQRIPYIRTSGRPGLYQNRYASAVRVFRKICAGGTITEAERTALFTVATMQGKKIIESGDFKKLTGSPFYAHLNIPARWVEFYREADLGTKPSLRLSTIHGSKGGQAHRVILLTDMTQRVAENCDKNPDDEHRVFYVGMTRSMNTLDIVEGHNGFKVIGD